MRSEAPVGWTGARLGKHVDLLVGFAFKSAEFTDDPDGIRLRRGDNVGQGRLRWSGARRWPLERNSEFERYEVRPRDIVLAMDRPWIDAGLKYAMVRDDDVPCLLVQRVARLRGTDTLSQHYLRYLIASPEFTSWVKAVQTGTAVPHISGGQIADYPFFLPPRQEQERIASVLGALDEKIDSNQRLARLLEGIVQAEFQRRFAGRLEGMGQLGDHVDVVRGRSYKSSELVESDRALVTLKSVRRGGGYNPDGLKPYSGDFKPEQEVEPGELVVAHTDLTQLAEVIGKPAVVPDRGKYASLIASLDLAIVRPRTPGLSVPFLYHLMLEPSFQQHAYGFANGSTVLHLSKQAIPSFPFEIPDRSSLAAYNELAQPIFDQTAVLASEVRCLATVRETLLPKLISGQIRVPDSADPDEVLESLAEEAG